MRTRLDRPSGKRKQSAPAAMSSSGAAARSGPAVAGLSTGDSVKLREILETDPVWRAFVEEFGDEPVLALIRSQGWTGRGSQIVDASGRPVDPKVVRKLLEQHHGSAPAHDAKAAAAGKAVPVQPAAAASAGRASSSPEPAPQR